MKFSWKLPLAVAVIAVGAAGLTFNKGTWGQVVSVWRQISQTTAHAEEAAPDKSWLPTDAAKTKTPWDRTLTLDADQIKAIGMEKEAVQPQTEPTKLRLYGQTDYDPATLTIVRTQFDSRVDKVLVNLGATVKKGQDLLELFSTDLAEAKSNYEVATSQWIHDNKVLNYKTPLANSNTLPKKELIEAENDEAQSRLKMKLAKDKLLVYGLTEEEIKNAPSEDGVQKAKMILRSRADGVVVKRNVVQGNYYDSTKELMVIAPLDHLWVLGNVSELDAEKVEVGQKLEIVFPFSDRTIDTQVDYIDKAIDPETRSAKFRTTIGNPERRFKAGMFVKVVAQISPRKGRTVIPRGAMVSVDRLDYVFVRVPSPVEKVAAQIAGGLFSFYGSTLDKGGPASVPKPLSSGTYERRPIFVAMERNDIVIVAEPSEGHRGLVPGEEVVTTGSLILEQMYEDRTMAEGGLLVSQPGQERLDPFRRTELVITTQP